MIEDSETGVIMFESRAVARYFAIKYANIGPSLIPPVGDLKAYTVFEQALNIESMKIDPYASPLIFARFFAPYVLIFFACLICAHSCQFVLFLVNISPYNMSREYKIRHQIY